MKDPDVPGTHSVGACKLEDFLHDLGIVDVFPVGVGANVDVARDDLTYRQS